MNCNQAGIDLIKFYEGLRLESYKHTGDVWTVGYGHTKGVKPNMQITKDEAEELLRKDLEHFEDAVTRLVKVPLNENQFSALVSFAYNCGEGALATSTALRRLNSGDYKGCTEALQWYNKGSSGNVLPGLTKRRKAEAELFSLEPTQVVVPTYTQTLERTPLTIQAPMNNSSSFLFNTYRYFKDLPHQRSAIAYLEQHTSPEVLQEMQELWRAGNVIAQVQKMQVREDKPIRLVDKIVAYMKDKGYVVFNESGKRNIVYVEGMNPDGRLNDDRPNWFNDIRCVFEYRDGKPEMLGIWQGSTEPGSHYTHRPMNPKGCARIAFGQYQSAWAVGLHGTRHRYEALVQVGNVTVHRDLNKDFKRTGDKLYTGNDYYINQHHGGNAAENSLGMHSAGCLIGRTVEGHQQFMKIVKGDPDYQQNKHYRFTTTVIPGDELVKLYP